MLLSLCRTLDLFEFDRCLLTPGPMQSCDVNFKNCALDFSFSSNTSFFTLAATALAHTHTLSDYELLSEQQSIMKSENKSSCAVNFVCTGLCFSCLLVERSVTVLWDTCGSCLNLLNNFPAKMCQSIL